MSNTTPRPTDPEAVLTRKGLALPAAPRPVAAYIPSRRSGSLLFVSGQIPIVDGRLIATGTVPSAVSLELAQRCSVQCVLNALAVAKAAVGSLDAISRVIRLGVFVACDAGFGDQPKVANAASELLVELFGEDGQHARAAVGAPALPLMVPVEIEFVFEVR
jgi:enamine deaminase RidA (YjgF/YER057c/UK114 family)